MTTRWQHISTWMQKLLKLCVSVLLLAWIVMRVDLSAAGNALRELWWPVFFIGFFIYAISMLFTVRRLQILLKAQGEILSNAKAIKLSLIGIFANNFLPGTVGGDAVKIIGLGKLGHNIELSAASVVMDRLVSFTAMMSIIPVVLLVPELLPREIAYTVSIFALVCFFGGIMIVNRIALNSKRGKLRTEIHSCVGLYTKIRIILQSISEIVSRWMENPLTLVFSLGLSLIYYFSVLLSIWIVSLGLSLEVTFLELTAVITLVYFISQIPISVNSFGLQEASLVYFLSLLGANLDKAIVLAVIIRLFQILLGLPAIGWLIQSNTKFNPGGSGK